jgi:tetratricopeptide (TPR) repeat protein
VADARAGDYGILARAGKRLLDAGDPKRAAVCFELVLEQTGFEQPNVLLQLAMARLGENRLTEARQAFLAVNRLRPRDPRPHYYLGRIALQLGDETEGRTRLGMAQSLNPSSTLPLITLAEWLDSEERGDEALEIAREAIRRNPSDSRARRLVERLAGSD